MRVLLAFILLLVSSITTAGELQFYDIVINVEDTWDFQTTSSGAVINISKGENLEFYVMVAPEEPTIEQIHGKNDPQDFKKWGEFYGSESNKVDLITGDTKYSWLLYNGKYVMLVQYSSKEPKSLDLIKKNMSTLKRVSP